MRNLQEMMAQVKKMQDEMQQKMDSLRVEGSAGGGVVLVEMTGARRLLKVRIAPDAVKDGDVDMLQDLVQAAVNDALRKVDDGLKDLLGGLAGGIKIPGLF
jgi:DNA-binding YbaB/EbfC family protein